jgi:oligosaccharide repeat unit polymerase
VYDFLLLANLTLWLLLSMFYARQPCASVYHPATYYLFFHFLVFTFRPFLAWYRDYDGLYRAYEFVPSMDDKITVMLAAMLGMLCFVLPSIWFGSAAPRFPQDRINEAERREMIRPFLLAAGLIVPFGVISALTNWYTAASDASTMVRDAATGYNVNTTGNGYFDNLQLLLAPLAVIYVWLYRFRWWTLLPLAGFIVLRAGTGGRWPFIMACGTAVLLFLYERRRLWPDWRATVLGIAALAIFQAVGSDRGASIRQVFVEDNSAQSYGYTGGDLRFMEGMDFANLEFFEYLVYAVPQRTGTYDYFLDNLQLFTQPIPRVLWEGKPVGPPIQLYSLFDYGYPIGMTYSLPGEGWVQLGYIGVMIWCGLFGGLYGWIYNAFQRSRHGNPVTITYLLFLPLSLTFFRDGFLLTLVQTVAFFLFPVWLIVRIARLSAVPLAEELRMMAHRNLAKNQPQIAQKILARQRGRGRQARSRFTSAR